jgi:5-methylthioadenosine/S-adenosylhomocysteine deaminase
MICINTKKLNTYLIMNTSSDQIDLILTGRYLLPSSTQVSLLENAGIAIAGDTIAAIGQANDLVRLYPDVKHLHEPHGLIMPGLINTHTHAAMTCFRGLADDLPLMTWLQDHIFPIEAKLTGDMVYHATLLSLAEMIKSGTTSFCDMYLFSGDVARATEKAGMRGWIGEVLYDFPSPSYGELENGFTYVKEMFAQYRHHPLITITSDPHSVYTCSPDLLRRIGEMAEKQGSMYVIHLSENLAEVNTCRERYGCSPVNHLKNLGLLNERTLADHCVVLNDEEIDLLAENRVKVAHCVESNMKLASGTAPVVKMLARGLTLSIGTDGSASNNDVDMFSEMNSVAKMHKVACMDPTVMNAETTLHAATMGGAKALLAEDKIGSIAVSKKADVIVLDLHQPHLTPMYNVPSHLVYAARGADVIHSFINGRQVMHNRRLLTIDEDDILARMGGMGRDILQLCRQGHG